MISEKVIWRSWLRDLKVSVCSQPLTKSRSICLSRARYNVNLIVVQPLET